MNIKEFLQNNNLTDENINDIHNQMTQIQEEYTKLQKQAVELAEKTGLAVVLGTETYHPKFKESLFYKWNQSEGGKLKHDSVYHTITDFYQNLSQESGKKFNIVMEGFISEYHYEYLDTQDFFDSNWLTWFNSNC